MLNNDGDYARIEIEPERDTAILQYTGGTTGISKGAMLSHANLYVNTLQTALWMSDLRQGDERMMGVLITPLALQLRITTPATAHRIFRDYIEALNQDPDKYVMPPADEERGPAITAEEAISAVLSGEIPNGTPVEPIADHLRKLVEFQQSDDFGHVDTREELNIWRFYIASVQQRFQQEQRQQQLAAAAQQLQQGMAGGGGGDAGTGDAGGVPTTLDSDVEQPSPSNGLDSGTVEPTGGADGA
ncbi:hypothetical protein CMI37_07235 [Candidatus Pacearchaeota archaeon]|nr:hypothetical protein [Candidatus Pacearchaeota archaeon]